MESYENFALLYDTLMDDFDYPGWGEYIQQIFAKYNIKPKSILEMACGTGNLTKELLDRGYKVDGFDLSLDMLSQAQNKLSKRKGFSLFQMDMTSFQMKDRYDVVVAACDSLNYILGEKELKETFRRVYEHLEDEGIFIFDINSEYKLRNIIGNNVFIEDRDEIFYTWENSFDEETGICEFYLTFFHSEDGINYSRFDEVHRERAYSVDTIMNLLKEVGFSEVSHYKAFGFEKATHETERINFIANRNKR